MKNRIKKYLCMTFSVLFFVCSSYIQAYAAEITNVPAYSINERSISPRGATILQESGIISSNEVFTFTVPKTTTYTFSMSVTSIDGNTKGLWVMLQRNGDSSFIINKDISGSFQKRYELQSGTYTLILTCDTGRCTYGVGIHETY